MERILLVSATEKSRTMLSQFLTSCGVQAQLAPASSGAEAHSYIEQQAMNQRRSKRDIAEDIIGGKTP